MVYLSSSKFSLAVLGNMGFALALATYKVLLRVRRRRLCCGVRQGQQQTARVAATALTSS